VTRDPGPGDPDERRFELRDHTADVAVAAEGATLGAAFAAVADGLAAAMCDDVPGGGDRFAFEVRAEGREAALYDYLDQLIYERDVRGVLPVDNEVDVRKADGEWVVAASARGVPVSAVAARDVKAVTYSDMELAETGDGWRAYVVFDV
jgi:SHS2 domain-containing protein